ncbi:hypothetical protein FB451DRAFT_1237428, partial [Mycena latifolia]
MSNMSATPSTDEILFTLGQQMYRDDVPRNVGFLFYGIYFVFFCVYLWFTIHESTKPRATKILLAAMLLLFLSTTPCLACDASHRGGCGRASSCVSAVIRHASFAQPRRRGTSVSISVACEPSTSTLPMSPSNPCRLFPIHHNCNRGYVGPR